jgi:rubrerythrin
MGIRIIKEPILPGGLIIGNLKKADEAKYIECKGCGYWHNNKECPYCGRINE